LDCLPPLLLLLLLLALPTAAAFLVSNSQLAYTLLAELWMQHLDC